MKKRIFPVILLFSLSALGLVSCKNPTSESTSATVTTHYLVSFYVESTLYKTAQVKSGETVGDIIEAPHKEGYDFTAWTTKSGEVIDVTTEAVVSSRDLYALFTKKADASEDLNVEDIKDTAKTYYLVIGWYGKTSTSGLDVELMKTFYKNVRTYLTSCGTTKDQLSAISVRRYGGDDTDVAGMGSLINADGDCDIVIGVGNNINSTGGVTVIDKTGGITMGGKSRYIAKLTERDIVTTLYEFMKTENGIKLFDPTYTLTVTDII